jgi:hypothetical protein
MVQYESPELTRRPDSPSEVARPVSVVCSERSASAVCVDAGSLSWVRLRWSDGVSVVNLSA